jgi:UDP:flavonoid glycosyltransferase YjiC (YdhE family)
MAEKCDACIIQGGQGTIYAVMMGKCPFLAIPGFYEQRHNVENMLSFAECGKMLASYEVKAANIRKYLDDILENAAYSKNAEYVSSVIGRYFYDPQMRAEYKAADEIEKWIVTGMGEETA